MTGPPTCLCVPILLGNERWSPCPAGEAPRHGGHRDRDGEGRLAKLEIQPLRIPRLGGFATGNRSGRATLFFESEERPHVKEVNEGLRRLQAAAREISALLDGGRRLNLIHDVKYRANG